MHWLSYIDLPYDGCIAGRASEIVSNTGIAITTRNHMANSEGQYYICLEFHRTGHKRVEFAGKTWDQAKSYYESAVTDGMRDREFSVMPPRRAESSSDAEKSFGVSD